MKIIKIASETLTLKATTGVLTLYHGTSDVNAEKIQLEGLKKRNLGAGWYTLADNYADAKFHSNVGNGDPVVIEQW
jgi:RNA:NAD 2'-phosphotransferase (TPT1/KptA family)